MTTLDAFTLAYLEAALWSSTDDEGQPLDANYDVEDFDFATLVRMIADCAEFQRENAADLATHKRESLKRYSKEEMGGHNFWLTRNGHGAGFWDGDYPEEPGERLTDAAKRYREVELYVGDDGKVCGSPMGGKMEAPQPQAADEWEQIDGWCDGCGLAGWVWYNEATGQSLCDDCRNSA